MELEEMKVLVASVRELSGEGGVNCRRALAFNEYNVEKAAAFLKIYYYDSHGFRRTREFDEGF